MVALTDSAISGLNHTALPANTAMPAYAAMPMFLPVVRQKCTYGNMAESEFLCVRVAALLRSK